MILTMKVVLMLTMTMTMIVMVAMIMTMKVVVMVANPGHVPTRQSNERGISPTTNQHGQVNNDIIIIISLNLSSTMHFRFDLNRG